MGLSSLPVPRACFISDVRRKTGVEICHSGLKSCRVRSPHLPAAAPLPGRHADPTGRRSRTLAAVLPSRQLRAPLLPSGPWGPEGGVEGGRRCHLPCVSRESKIGVINDAARLRKDLLSPTLTEKSAFFQGAQCPGTDAGPEALQQLLLLRLMFPSMYLYIDI